MEKHNTEMILIMLNMNMKKIILIFLVIICGLSFVLINFNKEDVEVIDLIDKDYNTLVKISSSVMIVGNNEKTSILLPANQTVLYHWELRDMKDIRIEDVQYELKERGMSIKDFFSRIIYGTVTGRNNTYCEITFDPKTITKKFKCVYVWDEDETVIGETIYFTME